jgi:hypothetical protein
MRCSSIIANFCDGRSSALDERCRHSFGDDVDTSQRPLYERGMDVPLSATFFLSRNLSRGTGQKLRPSESKKGRENKPVTRSREPAHLDSLKALCRDGHRVHTVRIMQDGADQAGNAVAYRPRGIAFELDDLVCAVHDLQVCEQSRSETDRKGHRKKA